MTLMRQWFDQLETVLHSEAKLAGLLKHGTMIGNAREFFVARALRTVLPPSVHIGTGQVIGADGSRSNQIDVILYDATFPVLESQPGQGLYLVEGTIATIEVKSQITRKTLHESLTNCLSVHSINSPMKDIEPYEYVAPSTYIFGYTSTLRTKTAARAISEWINTIEPERQQSAGWLPQVIAGGSFLAISNGRWLQNHVTIEANNVSLKVQPQLMLWGSKQRFGFLLSNLVFTVAARFHPFKQRRCMEAYGSAKGFWQTTIGSDAQMIYEQAHVSATRRPTPDSGHSQANH